MYITSNQVQREEETPYLKTGYTEKIEAKTSPGLERACREEGGVGTCVMLTETYWDAQQDKDKGERTHIQLNLLANHKGAVLTDRETIYWVEKGQPYKLGKPFNAGEVLNDMLTMGFIKEFSEYDHNKGVAREALIKQRKKISEEVINIIRYYIDTPLGVIAKALSRWVKGHTWEQTFKNIEEATTSYVKHCTKTTFFLIDLKQQLEEGGITIGILNDLMCRIYPGYHPARKKHILTTLATHYGISIKEKERTNKEETKEAESLDIYGVLKNTPYISPTSSDVSLPCNKPSISPTSEGMSLPSTKVSASDDESLGVADAEVLIDVEFFDVDTREELVEQCASIRDKAREVMQEEAALCVGAYNDAIAGRLLEYAPIDILDMRQLEVMRKEGPLPVDYRLCSDRSPRLYGRGVDNLFYCRKEMRLAALEGLGFKDVDISGCHVHIALALWGEHLPCLKEHTANGTLWAHYEEIFKAEGIAFHKSLIKAMHHATFLGGGKGAYDKAWKSYNNHHVEAPLSREMMNEIEKIFKGTDIYQELKGLFRHLGRELEGKTVTVLTGEKFNVRGYRRFKDKDTGELRVSEGNLLTTISAILQSFEVTMLSYLIVRARALFIPVLWQHDGLTIKALYRNSVELMQEVLDEFTLKLLKKKFRLEVTELK